MVCGHFRWQSYFPIRIRIVLFFHLLFLLIVTTCLWNTVKTENPTYPCLYHTAIARGLIHLANRFVLSEQDPSEEGQGQCQCVHVSGCPLCVCEFFPCIQHIQSFHTQEFCALGDEAGISILYGSSHGHSWLAPGGEEFSSRQKCPGRSWIYFPREMSMRIN